LRHDAFDECVWEALNGEGFGVADASGVVEAALPIRSEPCVFDDDGADLIVRDAFDAARFVADQFPRVSPIR
jgi:hypothetical protein